MATLQLVKTNKGYALQGTDDSSQNADFSLFDLDGEGGDPFRYANTDIESVDGVASDEYDPDDEHGYSFWQAQEKVIKSAIKKGIKIPKYARVWE